MPLLRYRVIAALMICLSAVLGSQACAVEMHYRLACSAWGSLNIYDDRGAIVRELLYAAPRPANSIRTDV